MWSGDGRCDEISSQPNSSQFRYSSSSRRWTCVRFLNLLQRNPLRLEIHFATVKSAEHRMQNTLQIELPRRKSVTQYATYDKQCCASDATVAKPTWRAVDRIESNIVMSFPLTACSKCMRNWFTTIVSLSTMLTCGRGLAVVLSRCFLIAPCFFTETFVSWFVCVWGCHSVFTPWTVHSHGARMSWMNYYLLICWISPFEWLYK